jgi:hypothetical protein
LELEQRSPDGAFFYLFSSITLDVETAVSTRPLAFYPHIHLVAVNPLLGLDLGCRDLYPLRQLVLRQTLSIR